MSNEMKNCPVLDSAQLTQKQTTRSNSEPFPSGPHFYLLHGLANVMFVTLHMSSFQPELVLNHLHLTVFSPVLHLCSLLHLSIAYKR